MIHQNAQNVDHELNEKLAKALEATMESTTEIPVVDGNGHEFSFAEGQDNQQTEQNENTEIPVQEFDFAVWNNWVNNYLGFLDQQRIAMEEQLKTKDEMIEKLVLDLSNQEQKITGLIDQMTKDRQEFEQSIQTLQGQLKQVIEQVNSLPVYKQSSTESQYRYEDIPGYKNINPEVFRKECSYRKNTVSVVPFKDNVALMRTVFLIENQNNLTPDERNELKRLMLDF